MPDVLLLKTPYWDLVVWSKDISKQKQQLAQSMSSRGEGLPGSTIGFSVPQILERATELGVSIFVPDQPCLELKLSQPVFFEHTQYEFEFIFNEWVDNSERIPKLNHVLASVNDLFHYTKHQDTDSLRGNIDFTDNVGWFDLPLHYCIGTGQASESVDLTLSFEVWPTISKVNSDINRLHLAIDDLYPLWQYVLTKPDEQSAVLLPEPISTAQTFAYLWMAQFEPLLAQLEAAFELVLNAPHSRIVSVSTPGKDKSSERSSSFRTDIKSGSYSRRHQSAQNVVSVDTPENRFIKMVLSETVDKLQTYSCVAYKFARANNGLRLPLGFEQRLRGWILPLQRFLDDPLFKAVGGFSGLQKASMVLQRRLGYGQVFRQWHSLSLYVDVLGSSSLIEAQSIGKLYEIWCFIELKKVLLGLDFIEVNSPDYGLGYTNLQLHTNEGFCGVFVFSRSDGVIIRLAHAAIFEDQSDVVTDADTQPNILLEATYSDGQLLHWLFDTRYPLQTQPQLEDQHRRIVEQMSHYLTQLKTIYPHPQSTHGDDYGAVVLCPCLFEQQTLNNKEQNPFYDSIERHGIGAFPFLPRGKLASGSIVDSSWLKTLLKYQFGRA